jgi:hypothetical protein
MKNPRLLFLSHHLFFAHFKKMIDIKHFSFPLMPINISLQIKNKLQFGELLMHLDVWVVGTFQRHEQLPKTRLRKKSL